jgi:Holliday junction resolvase RusA-like endonuclease
MVREQRTGSRARKEPGSRKLRGEGAPVQGNVGGDDRGAGCSRDNGRDDLDADSPCVSGHYVGGGAEGRRVSYRLPFPLSVNNLFFNTKRGRVKTTRYQKWLLEVGALLKSQGIVKIYGPILLKILIIKPDRRRRDLDNYLKALIDALVLNGVMEDDSLIEKIIVSWHSDNLGGCFVEVSSQGVCSTEDQTRVEQVEAKGT